MEYDKTTAQGSPEAENYPHSTTTHKEGNGRQRVKSDENADISKLAESIEFPFSKRVAKNRFLKAPMTERLCHWNKDGEDIVREKPLATYTHVDQDRKLSF